MTRLSAQKTSKKKNKQTKKKTLSAALTYGLSRDFVPARLGPRLGRGGSAAKLGRGQGRLARRGPRRATARRQTRRGRTILAPLACYRRQLGKILTRITLWNSRAGTSAVVARHVFFLLLLVFELLQPHPNNLYTQLTVFTRTAHEELLFSK